jgi:hypothetical protein
VTSRHRHKSGQIILIAAFVIATLLLSTELYILDVVKVTSEVDSNSINDIIPSVQLGSKHVVVGSLANITNGGIGNILEANLQQWSSFISRRRGFGRSTLSYTVEETDPYSAGVRLQWTANGAGISSAYSNFTYDLLDQEGTFNRTYAVNVTSTVLIETLYRTDITGNTTQVNMTINLLNEGNPAFASQITVYYRASDTWQIPDETNSYAITNYGNGTYLASFITEIPSQPPETSIHVIDQRGIYVQANITAKET